MKIEKTADAVIIGGGILGASVAHFLSKKGIGKVILIEKRGLASESTGHSAANIRTAYSNQLTIRLALRSLEMFENDEEELGGKTNFRRTRLELFSLGSFHVPIFCLFRIFFFRRRFQFSCFRAYLRGRGYRSLTKDVTI